MNEPAKPSTPSSASPEKKEPREGPVMFLAAIALVVILGFATLAAMTLSLIIYPPPQPAGDGASGTPSADAPANPGTTSAP